MINTYHYLCAANTEPKITMENRTIENEGSYLHDVLIEKGKKMVRELKSAKIVHPEKSNEINWFIDTFIDHVNSGESFTLTLDRSRDFYYVNYVKDSSLTIIKKSYNENISIRSYAIN